MRLNRLPRVSDGNLGWPLQVLIYLSTFLQGLHRLHYSRQQLLGPNARPRGFEFQMWRLSVPSTVQPVLQLYAQQLLLDYELHRVARHHSCVRLFFCIKSTFLMLREHSLFSGPRNSWIFSCIGRRQNIAKKIVRFRYNFQITIECMPSCRSDFSYRQELTHLRPKFTRLPSIVVSRE